MARSFLPNAAAAASLDISDPTDFNSTSLPGLAALDASLRCEICKDFYDAPVITSCGHTFCSLCIRRCLGADGKCATCRANEQESRLKKNSAIAGAVEAFQAVRESVLKAVSKKEEKAKVEVGELRGRPRRGDGDGDGGFELEEEEIEDETDTPVASQRSARSRTSTRSSARGGSRTRKVARRRGGDDDDDFPGDGNVQVISDSEIPTSTPRRAPRRAAAPPDDGLVPCPVCSTRLTQSQVEAQIENCLAGKPHTTPPSAPASPRKPFTFGQRTLLSQSTASSSSAPPKLSPRKSSSSFSLSSSNPNSSNPELLPLPKLTYSMLSESALRKKLQALGIRSDGPKKLLQERHTEWINIWNANVDSQQPKKRRALIADLDEWERAHARPPNRAAPGPVGKGYAKDWDDKKYMGEHREEFEDLIVKAKESAKRRKVESEEARRKTEVEERERMEEGEGKGDMEIMESSQGQRVSAEGMGGRSPIPQPPPSTSLSQPPQQMSKPSSLTPPQPSTAPPAPPANPIPSLGNYSSSPYIGPLPSNAPPAQSPIVPQIQHHYAPPSSTAPSPPKPFCNPLTNLNPPPPQPQSLQQPSSSSTTAPSSHHILHSDPGPRTPPRKRKFDAIRGTPLYGDEDSQNIDLTGEFMSHDEEDCFAMC